MIFASITGRQLLATINPLLALLEQGREISRVVLIPTVNTVDQAERVRSWLAERGIFPAESIILSPASSSLEAENSTPPVLEVLQQLQTETDNLFFNVAGGLNFLIAACTQVLDPDRSTLLYPEKGGIYQITLQNRQPQVLRLPTPSTLPLENIFMIQGGEFTPSPAGIPKLLQELFRSCRMQLPRGAVSGTIKDVSFDAVWNDGNTLRFLLHLPTYDLARIRRLIAFFKDRDSMSDLLHREIAVITVNEQVLERLEEDGRGITLIRHTSALALELKQFIGSFALAGEAAGTTLIATGRQPGNNSLLLTSLGKDPSATFAALASHRPGRAMLCYTPGDPEISRYVRRLSANAALLPEELAELCFVPVSMLGSEILTIVPPHGVDGLAVNITPGLKSHGFFLALWGLWNGARVYSLQNQKQYLARLDAPADYPLTPLTSIRPRDFLTLRGENLRESCYKKNIRHDKSIALLSELLQGLLPDAPPSSFPKYPLTVGEFNSRYIRQGEHELLEVRKGKESYRIPARESFWFELLVGHALARGGATYVDLQITARWGKEIEARLLKKQNPGEKAPHRTEIDVAALFGGRYVIVSCKNWDPAEYDCFAGKTDRVAAAALEVKAMTSLFGRFALPLLAFFGYHGEPYQVEGVTVFGCKTLLDPKAVHGLVSSGFSRLGSTVQSA